MYRCKKNNKLRPRKALRIRLSNFFKECSPKEVAGSTVDKDPLATNMPDEELKLEDILKHADITSKDEATKPPSSLQI